MTACNKRLPIFGKNESTIIIDRVKVCQMSSYLRERRIESDDDLVNETGSVAH